MGQGGLASGNRLDGEVGYGLPVGSRFVGTPRVGFSTSEHGRDYRVGYGLGVLEQGNVNFELGGGRAAPGEPDGGRYQQRVPRPREAGLVKRPREGRARSRAWRERRD